MNATTAAAIVLAIAWTTLTNLAYSRQHDAAASVPALSIHHPMQGVRNLFADRGWVAALGLEVCGFALYAGAVGLGSLALVQSIGAGGIGVLAWLTARVAGHRLERRQLVAVGLSVLGLMALGVSLAHGSGEGGHGNTGAILIWMVACAAVALVALAVGRARGALAVAEGLAGGLFSSIGDLSTKLATQGGARLGFAAGAVIGYVIGTALLQLGYQRGETLSVAGIATLFTNAVPIAAGTVLLGEPVPSGAFGVLRIGAFGAVVLGAILLAAPQHASSPPCTADGGKTATISTDDHPAPDPPLDALLSPRDEDGVIAAVRYAAAHGRRLRVRGAGHAPAGTVVSDDPRDLVMTLGQMRGLRVLDEGERMVEAQAGIHLGRDPAAGGPEGLLQNSLLFQLADRYGWTLASTGGITHQTLGGFLATASAGGTLQHALLDQIVTVRLVDGRGQVRTFSGWEGPSGLAAVLPSLGLLGVITAVTLRCEPLFTIAGQEAIVDLPRSPIDLEGPGGDERLSLQDFLTQAEYARIEWWPQRRAERLLIWQAQRLPVAPGFAATRYEEFTRYPILAEALIGTLYTLFGNLERPERVGPLLTRNADHLKGALEWLAAAGRLTRRQRLVFGLVPRALRTAARVSPLLITLLGPALERSLPWLMPAVLNRFLTLDVRRPGMRRGEPQSFRDWSWEGLPMDNQASDVLLGTRFSEMWVPLTRAGEVVRVLRTYFAQPRSAQNAFRRTGLFAYELYGAPATPAWMHPGHSDGEDEWRAGALRIDVYWFDDNAEDPTESFFPQFWSLLRDHDIPFRLHWGKEQPASSPADRGWVDFFRAQYPRWDDFLALRAELDPHEVFLTQYWRDRLGLWPAPEGQPPAAKVGSAPDPTARRSP